MSTPAAKNSTKPAEAVAEAISYRSAYPSIRYPAAPGGVIEFAGGEYTTADAAEIDYLDQRETCERAK